MRIDRYGGLFIASAGNSGTNNDAVPIYPASYTSGNILSVASIDPYHTLARFSNYGFESVDIAAPGTGILSLDLQGGYTPKNGTSMSAPACRRRGGLAEGVYARLIRFDDQKHHPIQRGENPRLGREGPDPAARWM